MIRLNIQPQAGTDLEILSALFNSYNIDGIEMLEDSMLVYLTDEYFQDQEFKTALKDLNDIQPFEFTSEELPEINWNKEWESNFDPVFVDDFLTIKADFHNIEIKTKEVITINPKMSFGTGHHATTWMMSKAMSLLNHNDKKVMDAGSGTGVLAILASKLGAKEVVAFDNDPWCYENALENIEINSINNIQLYEGSLEDIKEDKFDIILANINRNFLLAHGPQFQEKMNPNGLLMLSGFFYEESHLILDYFHSLGMVAQYLLHRDEWACVVLKNRS